MPARALRPAPSRPTAPRSRSKAARPPPGVCVLRRGGRGAHPSRLSESPRVGAGAPRPAPSCPRGRRAPPAAEPPPPRAARSSMRAAHGAGAAIRVMTRIPRLPQLRVGACRTPARRSRRLRGGAAGSRLLHACGPAGNHVQWAGPSRAGRQR